MKLDMNDFIYLVNINRYILNTKKWIDIIIFRWDNKLNIFINRWCGSKINNAFTENPRCWDLDKKQVDKWAAEGAVKCVFHKVFCDVVDKR